VFVGARTLRNVRVGRAMILTINLVAAGLVDRLLARLVGSSGSAADHS